MHQKTTYEKTMINDQDRATGRRTLPPGSAFTLATTAVVFLLVGGTAELLMSPGPAARTILPPRPATTSGMVPSPPALIAPQKIGDTSTPSRPGRSFRTDRPEIPEASVKESRATLSTAGAARPRTGVTEMPAQPGSPIPTFHSPSARPTSSIPEVTITDDPSPTITPSEGNLGNGTRPPTP
jgi:hypothetical protein